MAMSRIRATAPSTSGRPGSLLVPVGAMVLFGVPAIAMVLAAFSGQWRFPDVLPTTWSARGLRFVVANRAAILKSVTVSVGYSLMTVLLSIALCVAPARILARYEFRGRLMLEALFLSPVLIPSITWGMGIHFLLIQAGIANRIIAVVLVLTAASYPYMLRALIAGFQLIEPDIDVCARNLGAGPLRRLWTVHLPLLGPAMLSGGTVVFLVAFSEYFLVFLIGGGAVPSFTGFLVPYLSAGDRTLGATLTVIFALVPIVLFVTLDRSVVRFYHRRGMG